MIFDSDSSESDNPVSCFCDSTARKGVDGASLRREKEVIQLASVRNKSICFGETSNYNLRQRKLANFLSLESNSGASGDIGAERRNGDWIMCLNRTEGSVKTYPWTNAKQKFELVPWRKQKRQLDIINYTAWEPDELAAMDGNGIKGRKYKQHPPPAAHNQEIRRLIRLRFLFSAELQHQKQLKLLSYRSEESEEYAVTPRQFKNVLKSNAGEGVDTGMKREDGDEDEDSACDGNSFCTDPKQLASNYVGYFGIEGDGEREDCAGSEQQNYSADMCKEALSAFNYSDWLACCDSFRCSECKRY